MISDKEWSKVLTLIERGQVREGPEPFPPIAAWSALKNDKAVKKAWKGFFAEALPFEIYVHIPFCNSICLFCNVSVRRVASCADRERYVNSLESEINTYGRLHPRGEAQKIFIGGGTPNLLKASQIRRLLSLLRKNFRVKRSAEILMEVNPEYMDNERLKAMKACGVTVLSFGIESLNADTIGAWGRTQTASAVKSAYLRCRKAGFKRIIMDMIAGLPHQGSAEFLKTLLELASWRPDEICMETFSPEGTLFSRKGGSITDAQRRQNENLIQRGFKMINSIGYHHRANESFASLRENEQGCRTYRNLFDHRTVLGLGAGSLSHIWGHYYSQNTADDREYSKLVSRDSLPAAFAATIKPKDEKISYIINSLSRGWISREEYFQIFHEPIEKEFKKQIVGLSDRRLVYLKEKSYYTVRPDRAEYDCSRFFYDPGTIKKIRLREKINPL